jgi:phosphoserine phosphatase
MNIFKRVVDSPVLVSDINRTLTYARRKPSLYSIMNFAVKSMRDFGYARAYSSLYIKDVQSDSDVGRGRLAANNWLLQGVDMKKLEAAAEDFLRFHERPGARKFLKLFRESGDNKKVVLVSRSDALGKAGKYFEAIQVSNEPVKEKGKYKRSLVLLKDGKDKLRAVREKLKSLGSSIEECTVIGDGKKDIDLIRESNVALVPRYAVPEVKADADYVFSGFDELHKGLLKEIQTR